MFWAPQPEAEALISQTTNIAGLDRDLRILEAAYVEYRKWRSRSSWWGQLFFPEPRHGAHAGTHIPGESS